MPEDLVRRFDEPPRSFSPVPIWWWSGEKLDAKRLRWRLERFEEEGWKSDWGAAQSGASP
jgi:hypothetical protein